MLPSLFQSSRLRRTCWGRGAQSHLRIRFKMTIHIILAKFFPADNHFCKTKAYFPLFLSACSKIRLTPAPASKMYIQKYSQSIKTTSEVRLPYTESPGL